MADHPKDLPPDAKVGGLNAEALFAHGLAGQRTPTGGRRVWEPPTVEELQRALPQYDILEMLGRGGMGAVYKGTQRSLDRFVAIKILPPGLEDDHDVDYAERFKMEAKSMARLSHPGIVAVFDAGETAPSAGSGQADGLLYFVMEFVEGTDVQQMIAQGPLPPEHALAIAAHVCDALGFAHESGIVHRDIKPANIMVDARGHVKVADFGLAKVTTQDSGGFTGTHFTMGTPNYIAPEAMTSVATVDGRADLYAVGVMLYAMLTGEIPRGRFALPSTRVAGLDPRFDAIVDKAMQADREHRYASAAALRSDLDCLLTAPIPVDAPLPLRHKVPMLVAALAVVVLAASGWFAWKSWPAAAAGSQAFVLEPGAIKLWDTPEKIPTSTKLRWEKNAVRLDGQPLRERVRVRDLVFRATVLLNPDAVSPQINARVRSSADGDLAGRFYCFGFSGDFKRLVLNAVIGGQRNVLYEWPLPRPPGPDQWMRLELRIVGDDITASADGKVLGTVRDSSIPDAGWVEIFAKAAGYFRDIVYVPLDKAASTVAAVEPGTIKLWDVPEKVTVKPGVEWKDGVLILGGKTWGAMGFGEPKSRDAIIRASIRMNLNADFPTIGLRTTGSGDAKTRPRYTLGIRPDKHEVALITVAIGDIGTDLKTWPLPRTYSTDEWVRLELRAIGDELTATLDGKVLGVIHDASQSGPGEVRVSARAHGYFRNIEYVPLDKAGTVSPSPSLPVSPSSAAATLAANPADWVDRLTTRKWEGAWLLENGVLKTTTKSTMSGNLATMQDGAIRVRARVARSTGYQLQLILRSGVVPRVANTDGLYQLMTSQNGMACTLIYAERRNKDAETESRERLWINAPLPAAVVRQDEMEWELRAVGDEFSAWANGQFIASTHHTRVPRGAASFTSDLGLDIIKVETIAFASSTAMPRWQKVVFSAEDLTKPGTQLDAAGELTVKWGIDLPGIRARNLALRGELRRATGTDNANGAARLQIQMRYNEAGARLFAPFSTQALIQVLRNPNFITEPNRIEYPAGTADPGDWVPFQFSTVGQFSCGSVRGCVFPRSQSPEMVEPGSVRLIGEGSFRNLEVLLLDGLPEDEALKLAAPGASASNAAAMPGPAAPTEVLTFGGHRYQFVRGAFTSSEARAKAEALGGHLATLTTREEADWAKTTYLTRIGNALWLGARRQPDGQWAWITGEPWDHTDWARWREGGGEPGHQADKSPALPQDFLELLWWATYVAPGGWDDVNEAAPIFPGASAASSSSGTTRENEHPVERIAIRPRTHGRGAPRASVERALDRTLIL